MPIEERPRIAPASRVSFMPDMTLGFQYLPDAFQGALQPVTDQAVHPSGHRRAEHRGRRLVGDPQLDPHAAGDLAEQEPAVLLDQPRLGNPRDLPRALPTAEAKHILERDPESSHLHSVPGADAGGLAAHRLPLAHALEHLRHVVVIGEVVEGALGRALDRHPRGELEPCHPNEDMGVVTWSGDAITTSDSVEVTRPLSGAQLRDAYIASVQDLSLGLVRFRDNAWRIGPIVLLSFGNESVGRDFV